MKASKMTWQSKLAAVLLCALASAASAGPLPHEIEPLAKEPANMLDLGFLRIEGVLNVVGKRNGYDDEPSIRYIEETGRIKILFFRTLREADSESWKESCTLDLAELVPDLDVRIFGPFFNPFAHRTSGKSEYKNVEATNLAVRSITDIELRVRPRGADIYLQGCSTTVQDFSTNDYSSIKFKQSKGLP